MKSFQPSPELRGFVDRLLDGEALSKPESARLEELLEEDDALTYFLLTVQQDDLLPQALASVPFTLPSPVQGHTVRIPVFLCGLATAAAVAFMTGLFIGQKPGQEKIAPSSGQLPDAPRVSLTGLVGVEWEKGSEPDMRSEGGPQRFALRTGLAELTYSNGVRVTVEGPADLSITGPNAARLDRGRLVASVPKGAEGFEVEYAGGKVVDLGTEFGLETSPSGKTELGVFDGKVELHRPDEEILSLVENQAVVMNQNGEDPVSAVPLDRGKFVRRIPTRDFRWELRGNDPVEVEFDVSHLVWKASDYRVLFKWMQGPIDAQARNVTLLLDGKPICQDPNTGQTGRHLGQVKNNLFELPVGAGEFRRGRWTLRATLQARAKMPPDTLIVGIFQFEEGLATKAQASDFIGIWSYRYAGAKLERHILPDGTIKLMRNGEWDKLAFVNGRWTVNHGVLRVTIPDKGLSEDHVLRDSGTMIFLSQPYDNAKKVPAE